MDKNILIFLKSKLNTKKFCVVIVMLFLTYLFCTFFCTTDKCATIATEVAESVLFNRLPSEDI